MLIDERFKDSSPEKTVEKILSILKSFQIETEEIWIDSHVRDCYSVHVSVKNSEFGSNGKGITKALARASGYAELMERMQAGYLSRRYFRDELLDYQDAVSVSADDFLQMCNHWLQDISSGMSSLFGSKIDTDVVVKKALEADSACEGNIRLLPFLDLTSGEMTYFPQKLICPLYNTNGLAAGNTFEEAFVQGFSEIIERSNMVKCFFNDITPPDVPEAYLAQYKKSYDIIQYLRENGLDIYIKDCSLGEPFPLLAVVAIDRKKHAYHVHMGAHPVFEIALERSLTEMFQGRTLNSVANTSDLFVGNAKTRTVAELIDLLTRGCGRYSTTFFTGTPSYDFKPFPDRDQMTNLQLLREITTYVEKAGHHMLVRSVSHLGFPSVRIIVPGMSEALPNNLADSFPSLQLLEKYADTALNLSSLDPAQRFEYLLFLNRQIQNYGPEAAKFDVITGKNLTNYNSRENTFLGRMLFADLEWNSNPANAIKYAKAVLPLAPECYNNKLSALCTVYDFIQNGKPAKDAIELIALFYEQETVTYLNDVFFNKVNPFENFIPGCSSVGCNRCIYNGTCNVVKTAQLIDKVREATLKYDNSSAFEELQQLFIRLESTK